MPIAQTKPLELHYWPTPNGWKITILLEELGVPYEVRYVDIGKGDQFTPEFLAIAPNNRMPALTDPEGPIGGMPVLECWKGKTTIVLKRSMATGYAGVQNPLFFLENTRMLFGDAKTTLEAVFKAL